MGEKLMREVFGETLVELGRKNPKIVVLDADMGRSTKVSKFSEYFPQRFFQMGVAEQNMMGVASGLASVGLIPFVVSFAAFIKRGLNQIRVLIAQPNLNVKIVGAYSGFSSSKSGKSHHAIQDIAIMRSMPNVKVVAPVDILEMKAVMHAIVNQKGPVYLRLIRGPSPIVMKEGMSFEVGKGIVLKEGSDVAIISTGIETVRALRAAEALISKGIDPYVLHISWIKPLDKEAIVRAAASTGAVVVAEEHNIIGGLGSAVAEVLGEELPTPLKRVGIPDVNADSADEDELVERYNVGVSHIICAAQEIIKQKKGGLRLPKQTRFVFERDIYAKI